MKSSTAIAERGEVALTRNLAAARSPATRRAYARAWSSFQTFAGSDMPADPYQVGIYLSELGTHSKPATVRLHASAIAAAHKDAGFASPISHVGVTRAIEGHARIARSAPEQAKGIDADAFEAISFHAMEPRMTSGGRMEKEQEAQFRGLVDVALIGIDARFDAAPFGGRCIGLDGHRITKGWKRASIHPPIENRSDGRR